MESPMPSPSRLGRIERLEDLRGALRVEARARIAHLDEHRVRAVAAGDDRELAGAVADRAHGVDRVEDEVEQHLLQLHPVALHPRQSLGELGAQHDAVTPDFVRRELDHLRDLEVDVDEVLARRLALHERPDPADDLARAPAVGGDALERAPRLRGLGRVGREPARARRRVRHHRAQRLVDLVRDRGGQFAQRRQPRHVGKLRPGDLQVIVFRAHDLLRELALADIARERQVEELAALPERAGADLDREDRAVLASMTRLERDRFARFGPLCESRDGRLVEGRIEIARVHADQFLSAPTQALAGLPVHVDDGELLVQQKKRIPRMVDERAKTRFARAQRALGPPQLRDVLHDAELANGTAGLVPRDISLAVHDAHPAVGPNDPVFDVVARPPAQGDLARLGGLLSIVGVDQTHPALLPLRQVEGLDAEDAAGLVGERYAAGRIVALPPPDAREALRCLEPALALPEVPKHGQHHHRIAEPAADLLEEAHFLGRPNPRVGALAQREDEDPIALLDLRFDRHRQHGLNAEAPPGPGRAPAAAIREPIAPGRRLPSVQRSSRSGPRRQRPRLPARGRGQIPDARAWRAA